MEIVFSVVLPLRIMLNASDNTGVDDEGEEEDLKESVLSAPVINFLKTPE